MKSDSATATTTTVPASGHRDAHLHERHQALWRRKEEDIPNNKRIHQLSDNHSPPKRFRSSRPAINCDEARKVERNLILAGSGMDHSEDGKTGLHKLFEKQLTRSDVGIRFVVPKGHALRCFPEVNNDEVVTLEVLDNQKKRWDFRSYWIDMKIFVLTKGWSRFVMEKGLREKDVVVFYRFEEEQEGHKNQLYMIDIKPFDNGSEKAILRKDADEVIENQTTEDSLDTIQKSVEKKMEHVSKKILTRGHEGVEEAAEKSSTGEQEVMKVEDEDRDKEMSLFTSEETNSEQNSVGGKEEVEVTDMKQERLKEGVWLFGVKISP